VHSAGIDDAEVCIAACLSKLDTKTRTEGDLEDEETMDDFFSRHRFEYVNAIEANDTTRLQSSHGEDHCALSRVDTP
jgi:hypothetical protein